MAVDGGGVQKRQVPYSRKLPNVIDVLQQYLQCLLYRNISMSKVLFSKVLQILM